MCMEPELRHLRYFIAIAEEGGFTRAAARLHMTQPPLSVAIRQLETALGSQLLDRSGTRVELTAEGRDFYVRAQSLLQQWQLLVADTLQTGAREPEQLVVAFRTAICHPLAHRTIQLLRDRHPEYRVLPRHVPWTEQTSCLEAGEADVSFVLQPADCSRVVTAAVAVLPRVVCLPAAHELADRDSVSLDDLGGLPMIRPAGASPGSSEFWGGQARPGRRSAEDQPTATCIEEAIDLVSLEGAAVLLPVSVTAVQRRQDVVFVPVTHVPAARMSLAWRKGSDSARVRAAVRCAQDAARDPAVRAIFSAPGAAVAN